MAASQNKGLMTVNCSERAQAFLNRLRIDGNQKMAAIGHFAT